MTVVVDGVDFDVLPTHYDVTVAELVAEVESRQRESVILEYLRKKYSGYVGVPTEYLEDELLLDSSQCRNFLKCHYGRKVPEFIDFEIIADYLSYKVAEQ